MEKRKKHENTSATWSHAKQFLTFEQKRELPVYDWCLRKEVEVLSSSDVVLPWYFWEEGYVLRETWYDDIALH